MIGIIKKINIPLRVINWWAINTYEKVIKDKIIIKSLLLRYLGSLYIFLMTKNISINKGKCINLNLKKILENSKGKRK